MIPRAATGPIDELAGVLSDSRARLLTVELLAHRHLFPLDPSSWIAVAFVGGWGNLGAPAQVVQFRKVGDEVQIRGVMTGGAIGAVAFVLPIGFRPPATMYVAGASNGAYGQMSIDAAGNVTPMVGSAVWFGVETRFSITV